MNAEPERRVRGRRLLLGLAGTGAAALGAGALLLMRPFAKAAWPQRSPNPDSIYEPEIGPANNVSTVPVVSPFHLHTDPMAGLLLVNFEKDPDRIYRGFEPQAFDDQVHGRGLLVIGWRLDGRVDVFHDPALVLDPATYGIAGMGLHTMVERSFAGARFELGPGGAQVDLAFQDLEGRAVRLRVHETDTRPRHPFGFLAPMGSAASYPPALPLVFVNDFYFVRRAGTEVRIEIDGRGHGGDPFPLLLDGTRVHFLRYSADPFIATWNPSPGASAERLAVDGDASHGVCEAEARGVRYELEANGGFREIRRMSRREGHHEVLVEFAPAFPHLLALRDGVAVYGAFRISAHPPAGTVTGTWRVERRDSEIDLMAVPDGGWTPGETPRVVRLLFRAVSMFRTWPTTYLWRATLKRPVVHQDMHFPLPLQSAWTRT